MTPATKTGSTGIDGVHGNDIPVTAARVLAPFSPASAAGSRLRLAPPA